MKTRDTSGFSVDYKNGRLTQLVEYESQTNMSAYEK